MVERIACIPNLQTYVDYNGVQFLGDETLAETVIRKMPGDETLDLNAKGVFIAVRLEPNRGRGQVCPGARQQLMNLRKAVCA